MTYALETQELGKCYGDIWAVHGCTIQLPVGCLAGLVGPNGAGKTTLMQMAAGLIRPSMGDIRVFGFSPTNEQTEVLTRIGFMAQDRPLYRGFPVRDMLTFGRKLNIHWNDELARSQLELFGIPLDRPVGKLSGGQQAQVALVMALAKNPELLLLDEPIANLDPLARQKFQQTLIQVAATRRLTTLFSSHIVADLERICNYVIILSASRVQVASSIEQILQTHKQVLVPHEQAQAVTSNYNVIGADRSGARSAFLVRIDGQPLDTRWETLNVTLEEIILAYLAQPNAGKGIEANKQEAFL